MMMRMPKKVPARGKRRLIAAMTIPLLAAACTTPMAKHDYQDGWRHVEFVAAAGDHGGQFQLSIDCRKETETIAAVNRWHFVLVKENKRILVSDKLRKTHQKWVYQMRYWIVPVNDAEQLKAGDPMYANSNNCQLPAVQS